MGNLVDFLVARKADSIRRSIARSDKWFHNLMKKAAADDRKNTTTRPTIGKLYTFAYDAKLKDTLNYWDFFPMSMPISMYPDGWLGMNFHYLPPKVRAVLLDKLMDFSTTKNITERTRLKLSYNLLKGVSRYKEFQPTLHRYLNSHIRSRIFVIPPDDWSLAVLLPTAKFKSKTQAVTKNQVYKDSRAIIRGR